jgi:hypothetical protein
LDTEKLIRDFEKSGNKVTVVPPQAKSYELMTPAEQEAYDKAHPKKRKAGRTPTKKVVYVLPEGGCTGCPRKEQCGKRWIEEGKFLCDAITKAIKEEWHNCEEKPMDEAVIDLLASAQETGWYNVHGTFKEIQPGIPFHGRYPSDELETLGKLLRHHNSDLTREERLFAMLRYNSVSEKKIKETMHLNDNAFRKLKERVFTKMPDKRSHSDQ